MYSIQFGTRAGFLDEKNAERVLQAIRESERFVTVSVDIANDGGEPHEVTLNVNSIVSLIKHRVAPSQEPPCVLAATDDSLRPHLSIVS